jgi:hypothetical protein
MYTYICIYICIYYICIYIHKKCKYFTYVISSSIIIILHYNYSSVGEGKKFVSTAQKQSIQENYAGYLKIILLKAKFLNFNFTYHFSWF